MVDDVKERGSEAEFVGFAGPLRIAAGSLPQVALAAKRALDRQHDVALLIFDRDTAEVIDLDLRGSEKDVIGRLAAPVIAQAKRGRPKLGVIAREVTLLPRHWEWLARQPGGASVTLRRLVETARKAEAGAEVSRARTEATYRFMAAMAGDLPGFEEAARALFALDRTALERCMLRWRPDIRDETLRFFDSVLAD
jgi:hypothetical protein